MKRISSNLTPLLKYIVPWTIIIFLIVALVISFVHGEYYLGFGVIIIGTPIVGFMKAMLMDLKIVFIDTHQGVLVVKGETSEIIPYNDIREILKPWTAPYIATVQLTKDYSFGKTFTFIPDDIAIPFFWDSYDKKLKAKIRN